VKVLVTGGAGFIGSHVVSRLVSQPGTEVVVIDDFNNFYDPAIKRENVCQLGDNITLVEGDIRDGRTVDDLFSRAGFDTVIHLAARAGVRPSIEDPALYVSTNVNGTLNLLDAAARSGVEKFIFASSSSVYGVNKKVPFSEDDRIARTISPYAATKLAGEELCSNYAQHFGLKIVGLRFFTVYGPGQRPDLAISKFVSLIENGQPIDKYGDGSSGRDYTYIDDIVDGVMSALRYAGSDFEIFNLGGSQSITLNKLIETVETALGKTAVINRMSDQPGDVPLTSADVSKAQRLLGYEPKVDIEEGVRRYVEWFHQQRRELGAAAGVV